MKHPINLGLVTLLFSSSALAVDVAGLIEKPDPAHGKAPNYRLTGDTTFDWRMGPVPGDIDLNGHTLTMETGGGNITVFHGAITGKGALLWLGGGQDRWQTTPSVLTGAKPKGVAAFAGALLVLGGGSNQAIVQLNASDQIDDACRVRITGNHEGRIWTQGHGETVGPLDLQSHGSIDLGNGECTLTFADSSGEKWNAAKTLTIDHWTEGKDKVVFKGGKAGLTPQQVARIGFADPSGRDAGLYRAVLNADGQLVPDQRVEAVKPPFDVSDAAKEMRRAIYEVNGREKLTNANNPLRDGTSISFFGDSLTWQNVFIFRIEQAIKTGAATKALKVALHNHGINGGGVLAVRDGADKAAYVDARNQDGPQAPFAEVIRKDKATVAVVLIGINDVWWRNTKPADFEAALRDIAAAAKKNKTALVLATLTTIEEMPDGSNPKDKACDAFAELTRKVAKETGTTLVDLRDVVKAYLQNHNAKLRVDGSLVMSKSGILTYDGVHPNDAGNDLLADHLTAGIDRALRGEQTPGK